MQTRRSQTYITPAAAAKILKLTPHDVAAIADRGELDSTETDGVLMVTKRSVEIYRFKVRPGGAA